MPFFLQNVLFWCHGNALKWTVDQILQPPHPNYGPWYSDYDKTNGGKTRGIVIIIKLKGFTDHSMLTKKINGGMDHGIMTIKKINGSADNGRVTIINLNGCTDIGMLTIKK